MHRLFVILLLLTLSACDSIVDSHGYLTTIHPTEACVNGVVYYRYDRSLTPKYSPGSHYPDTCDGSRQ